MNTYVHHNEKYVLFILSLVKRASSSQAHAVHISTTEQIIIIIVIIKCIL